MNALENWSTWGSSPDDKTNIQQQTILKSIVNSFRFGLLSGADVSKFNLIFILWRFSEFRRLYPGTNPLEICPRRAFVFYYFVVLITSKTSSSFFNVKNTHHRN